MSRGLGDVYKRQVCVCVCVCLCVCEAELRTQEIVRWWKIVSLEHILLLITLAGTLDVRETDGAVLTFRAADQKTDDAWGGRPTCWVARSLSHFAQHVR